MINLLMTVLTVLAVVGGIFAAPQDPAAHQQAQAYSANGQSPATDVVAIPIISQTDANGADGSFNYSYEAGNGIKYQGSGFPKRISVPVLNADGQPTGQTEDKDIIVQTGSYSYTSPDGAVITLNYVADENGFQPVGDHIPTPPAIPDQILSSLKQQAGGSAPIPVNNNIGAASGNQQTFTAPISVPENAPQVIV